LMAANKAALHIPLKAPAAMLSTTIFRECRTKKAKIFTGFHPSSCVLSELHRANRGGQNPWPSYFV
jgi:hypothetical protein